MLNILEATPISDKYDGGESCAPSFFPGPSICHAIRQTPVVDVGKKKNETNETSRLVIGGFHGLSTSRKGCQSLSDIPCKLGISDGIAVGKLGKISQMSDLFGYFY